MSQAPPPAVESVADFATSARRPLFPLVIAGVLLALAATVATIQSPYRDAYGYGERGWGDWLIRPLEINSELRLPRVEGDLKDIAIAADGMTGFALGEGGAILATDNGGLDWRESRKAMPPRLRAIAVSADGLVAVAAGDREILIARGGEWQWRRADLVLSDDANDFAEVAVSDDGRRIRVLLYSDMSGRSPVLVRSNDGGATWLKIARPAGQVTAMAFDDSGQNGWLGTNSGAIFTTTDGGVIWTTAAGPATLSRPSLKVTLSLPAKSPMTAYRGAVSPTPLLLGSALSQPASGNVEDASPGAQQYPNTAVQGRPSKIPAEPTARPPPSTVGNTQQKPFPGRVTTLPAITVPTPGAALDSNSPRTGGVEGNQTNAPLERINPPPIGPKPVRETSSGPKADPTQGPITDPVEPIVDAQLVDPAASKIMALAFIPGSNSREVAGIRQMEGGSKLFIDGKDDDGPAALTVIAMGDADTGWAAGAGGIWGTNDGAKWTKQDTAVQGVLTAVAAARDGKRAWVTGNDGTLIATVDGGANWFHQLRKPGVADAQGGYARYPAPWFYLALIAFGGFVAYARRPLSAAPQPGVSAIGASDAPAVSLAEDKLQFAPLARGISRYLRNANTQPPLTLAISGDWGSGKSSLMQMVCEDLRRHGNHPVWFNAWHHQDEEQLLAALLAAIRDKALPPWLSLDGLRFRTHLFLLRARRSLPATLLRVGIASFCLALLLLSDPDDWARLANSLGLPFPGSARSGSADLRELIPFFAGIAGVVGALGGITKSLKAFGANPAVLLTSTIDNFKLRDATAQVHFRTRFQRQFDEVTATLPYPLVIVVDDLDRCRPETVLQVMESVNFLMSSGRCFVLFGMATHRVQAALAFSFKEIAAELVEIDVATPTAVKPDERDRAEREKRLKYAGEYLQKLINLEIRVPRREDIAPHLLLTRDTAPEAGDEIAVVRRWAGLLWPLALAAAVAGGSWWAGERMLDWTAASPKSAQSGTSTGNPTTAPTATPTGTIVEPPPPPPELNATAKVTPGIASDAGPYWPIIVLLGALLALVVALQYRRRKADGIVVDTQPFIEALQVWTPIVARRNPSPRAIKRFGNRLRYFAMLQQAEESEADGRWRWPDWLPLRVALIGARASPTVRTRVDVVAEHRIVALGAMHAVFGDKDWRTWVNGQQPGPNGSDYADIDRAIKAYKASGFRWPPNRKELDAFERSLKGIRLGGEVAVLDDAGVSTDPPESLSDVRPQSRPKLDEFREKIRKAGLSEPPA